MVRWHRCSTFGRRTFSTAGPMEWNSLPDLLWTLLGVPTASDRLWKLIFSQRKYIKGMSSVLEALRDAPYKSTTTTTTITVQRQQTSQWAAVHSLYSWSSSLWQLPTLTSPPARTFQVGSLTMASAISQWFNCFNTFTSCKKYNAE